MMDQLWRSRESAAGGRRKSVTRRSEEIWQNTLRLIQCQKEYGECRLSLVRQEEWTTTSDGDCKRI